MRGVRRLDGARCRQVVAFLAAAGFAFLLPACSSPRPRPGPPVQTDYVEWLAQETWDLSDLPAAAASCEQLCLRAASGDERARRLAAEAGTSLWVVRTLLLPVLQVLPGAEDVPAPESLAAECALEPDPDLLGAVFGFVAGEDREWAVERLLAVENQGAARHVDDEARLARVILAVSSLFPLAELGPGPALAAAVATLDPDDDLIVGARLAGGVCAQEPASDPCLWERLVAQALLDADGADAVDREGLAPAAVDALARRGLLDLVVRVLLPVAEDRFSAVSRLAAELAVRLGRALGTDRPPDGDQDPDGGEDWPQAAP